jgi:tetratricopeptide (TPR) repeat protein
MNGFFVESPSTKAPVSWEKYQKDLDPEKRIELIKKRRAEINSVRKGDYYAIKNNPQEALTYYLQVAEKLPEDVLIQKRIAHAYFLLKDWKNAYTYFINVPFTEMKESEQREMLFSLFFDESQSDRLAELYKIPTGEAIQEYYPFVDTCYTGIHNCIVRIEAYAGSGEKLVALKQASLDAAKVSPDFHYRNFVVAAKFYEFGDYRATEMLTREILETRPDYDEVRKLRWFALFELGRYNEAKAVLLQYLENHSQDMETIVRLGEIAFSTNDYITSNLYLNNAILAGYSPKTNLERRLAYNYSLLGDTMGMMKVLGYLVQEPDASEDDFAVAISLAHSQWENLRALVWAGEWIKIHPDSAILTPLYVTSLRLLGKTQDVEAVIDSLIPELQESPLILLEKGILYYDRAQYDQAKVYFRKVLAIDDAADFALEAQNYLDEITAIQAQAQPIFTGTTEPTTEEKGWWW